MSDETAAPAAAPTNGLAPPATPPAETPAKTAEGAAADQAKKPTAADWAEAAKVERRRKELQAQAAKDREAIAKEREDIAKQRAEIEAIKAKDPAAIMELLGGIDGYNKLTTHLLKQRQAAKAAGQPAPQPQDVNAAIAKAIEEHEAKKERAAAEAKAKAEQETKAATDALFDSLTKQSMELVTAGGERFEQIRAVVGKNAEHLNALLREVQAHLTSPEGWKVGDKVMRGETALDTALDMLEDALVERAEQLASAKVRARLRAEKPTETGGARKSETGGPSTLTSRLSQESSLLPRSADADQPGESPLAKRLREERETLAKAISDTEAAFKRKR